MPEANELKKTFRGLVAQRYAPRGGLASKFYENDPMRQVSGMEIEYDTIKEPQGLSTPSRWGGLAFMHKAAKYGTASVKPYYFKDQYSFGASDFAKKDIGMNPYEWDGNLIMGVYGKAVEQVALKIDKVARDKEYQAASEIVTGSIDMSIFPEASVPSLDFGRDASLSADLTGTVDVSDDTLDLALFERTIANLIIQQKWLAKRAPKAMVFGDNAWIGLQNNAQFIKRLEAATQANKEIVVETQNDREGGLNFGGWYNFGSYSMQMWTYQDDFSDPAASDPNALASRVDYFDPNSVSILTDNGTEVTGSGKILKSREVVNSILEPTVNMGDDFARWVDQTIGRTIEIDGIRMGVRGWYDPQGRFNMEFASHYLLMLNSPNTTSNYIIAT